MSLILPALFISIILTVSISLILIFLNSFLQYLAKGDNGRAFIVVVIAVIVIAIPAYAAYKHERDTFDVTSKAWAKQSNIEEYTESGWVPRDSIKTYGIDEEPYWLFQSEPGVYTDNKTNPQIGDLYEGHGFEDFYICIDGDWYKVSRADWESTEVGMTLRQTNNRYRIIETKTYLDSCEYVGELDDGFPTDIDKSDTAWNEGDWQNVGEWTIVIVLALIITAIVLFVFLKLIHYDLRPYLLDIKWRRTQRRNNTGSYGNTSSYERTNANNYQTTDEKPPVTKTVDFFKGCSTWEQTESRYKSLMKTYHPDMESGDEEYSKEINEQYRILKEKYGK